MELPLPNELLTLVFAYLDVRTLRAVCLSTRGLAHVARPFLYSLLPLPFIHLRNHGFVLDPGAYARIKAVTGDDGTSGEKNVSLRRAVKTVKITADGERTARRQYPKRLEWTPKSVVKTLLAKCNNLHRVTFGCHSVDELVEAIGPLPSSTKLDSLAFQALVSLSLITTLAKPISSHITALEAPLRSATTPIPFSLFACLRHLGLAVYHLPGSGNDTNGLRAFERLGPILRKAKQQHLPRLETVSLAFYCSTPWCWGSCRAPEVRYGRLDLGISASVVVAGEQEGLKLYFGGKRFAGTASAWDGLRAGTALEGTACHSQLGM